MSMEIIELKDGGGVCELSATGAKLKQGLSFEEWRGVGSSLAKASRSLQWWIGDWLNYGVREYGDKKALAIEHAGTFGVQAEMIRHCMWVSQKVVNRLTTLSWTHHREVAQLSPKEQSQWLAKAQENDWSVSELRQALRQDGKEMDDADGEAVGFNPLRMALDFNRWATRQDVAKLAPEARASLKVELRPVVELWEKL